MKTDERETSHRLTVLLASLGVLYSVLCSTLQQRISGFSQTPRHKHQINSLSMLIRKTFGRLRTLSRSVTTGQVESQQLDEEYLSAKSYETIPKVSSLKILWSMMDSKEKTRLDKVIKGYHDTAGKEWSTAGLRDSHRDTIIGRHAWKESIIGGIIIFLRNNRSKHVSRKNPERQQHQHHDPNQ